MLKYWGRRRACLYLGIAAGVVTARAWARDGRFTFHLPEGFKKPDEVTAPEGVVPDGLLEDARKLDAFGVALAGGEVVATFGALEQTGTPRFPASLADVKTMIERTPELHGWTAVSCTTPTIAGVKCSRIELDLPGSESDWRQLVYMVPGGDSWATLRVECARAHYERLAPKLDALVSALPGIASQVLPARPESDQDRANSLFGAIGGGALAGLLLRGFITRKRKPRKSKRGDVER